MKCAVCWYLMSGRLHTQATMVVNGQSVCDKHADIATAHTELNKTTKLIYDMDREAEKREDDAIEARRVRY